MLSMEKILPIIFILVLACKNQPRTNILTGDLYFSYLRVGSYYNQPDSLVKKSQLYFDSLALEKTDAETNKLERLYTILKKKKMLFQPFVQLMIQEDSVVILYLDTLDYNQIKVYKRQRLQDENKVVRIEASVTMIDSGFFYCDELKRIELVHGNTLQRQKKFKIEDYN